MKILVDEKHYFVVDDFCPPKMFNDIQRWAFAQKMRADSNRRVFGRRRVSKHFDADRPGPEMLKFFKRLAFYPGFSRRFLGNILSVEYLIASNGPGSTIDYHRDCDVKATLLFYIHNEWSEDWGGELMLKKRDNEFEGVFFDPIPNRLILIDHTVKHAVKAVARHSGYDRTAIVGYAP